MFIFTISVPRMCVRAYVHSHEIYMHPLTYRGISILSCSCLDISLVNCNTPCRGVHKSVRAAPLLFPFPLAAVTLSSSWGGNYTRPQWKFRSSGWVRNPRSCPCDLLCFAGPGRSQQFLCVIDKCQGCKKRAKKVAFFFF